MLGSFPPNLGQTSLPSLFAPREPTPLFNHFHSYCIAWSGQPRMGRLKVAQDEVLGNWCLMRFSPVGTADNLLYTNSKNALTDFELAPPKATDRPPPSFQRLDADQVPIVIYIPNRDRSVGVINPGPSFLSCAPNSPSSTGYPSRRSERDASPDSSDTSQFHRKALADY